MSVWMKFSMLTRLVGFVEAYTLYIHLISMQVREPYLDNLIKYSFNVSLCLNTYELIFVKLGMMIEMAELHSLT